MRVTLIDAASWADAQGDVEAVARRIGERSAPGWGVRDIRVEVDATGPPREIRAEAQRKALEREVGDLDAQVGAADRQIAKLHEWLSRPVSRSVPPRRRKVGSPRKFRFDAWSEFVRTCEGRLAAIQETRRGLIMERGRKRLQLERVSALLGHLHLAKSDEAGSLCKNLCITITPGEGSRELPSRRIGRAQTARPQAWRDKKPPPERLFQSYDRVFAEGKGQPDGEEVVTGVMLVECRSLAVRVAQETPCETEPTSAGLWTSVPAGSIERRAAPTGELGEAPTWGPPPSPPAACPAPSIVADISTLGRGGGLKVDLLPTESRSPSLAGMLVGAVPARTFCPSRYG